MPPVTLCSLLATPVPKDRHASYRRSNRNAFYSGGDSQRIAFCRTASYQGDGVHERRALRRSLYLLRILYQDSRKNDYNPAARDTP